MTSFEVASKSYDRLCWNKLVLEKNARSVWDAVNE